MTCNESKKEEEENPGSPVSALSCGSTVLALVPASERETTGYEPFDRGWRGYQGLEEDAGVLLCSHATALDLTVLRFRLP